MLVGDLPLDFAPLERLVGRKIHALRRITGPSYSLLLSPEWQAVCEDGSLWQLTGLVSHEVTIYPRGTRLTFWAERSEPVSSFAEPKLPC